MTQEPNLQLIKACRQLDIDEVKRALGEGADPAVLDDDGMPMLVLALLGKTKDQFDNTSLELPTHDQQYPVCEVLLAAGANPNIQGVRVNDSGDETLYYPLGLAIQSFWDAGILEQEAMDQGLLRLRWWFDAGAQPDKDQAHDIVDSLSWTLYNLWHDPRVSSDAANLAEIFSKETLIMLVEHGTPITGMDIDEAEVSQSTLIEGEVILAEGLARRELKALEARTAFAEGIRKASRL